MTFQKQNKAFSRLAGLLAGAMFFTSLPLEAKRETEKRPRIALAIEIVNRQATLGSLVTLLETLTNDKSGTFRKSLLEENVDLAAPVPTLTYRGGSIEAANLEQPIVVHDGEKGVISIASQRWRYAPKKELHWNFSKLRGMWEPYWRMRKKGPMSNVALAALAANLFVPSAAKAALALAGNAFAGPTVKAKADVRDMLSQMVTTVAVGALLAHKTESEMQSMLKEANATVPAPNGSPAEDDGPKKQKGL